MNQGNNMEAVRIPLHKKLWFSITKFERYPEMVAEGVGRTVGYLVWLMFLFAIILAIALIIKFNILAKQGIKYLDENFNKIEYQNGELSVQTFQEEASADFGSVLINTNELTQEQISEYQNTTSSKVQIIWLKDRVIAKNNINNMEFYYKDVLDNLGLKEFNKTELINFLNQKINTPQIYILYGTAMIVYLFLAYFFSALFDILILSVFGWITTLIAQIRMRYRAIFNMSVYAVTLSTILKLIYMIIQIFTDFNVKYFDLMYTTISFICLTAAIFMIKSDVIKQQIELMRVIEFKKQEEQQDEEKDEPEDKEDKEEKKDEKKEESPDKKEGNVGGDIEGSNA